LKGARAEDNAPASSSFITNAHNELYAFYTKKGGLLQINSEPIWEGGAASPPPPFFESATNRCCVLFFLGDVHSSQNSDPVIEI